MPGWGESYTKSIYFRKLEMSELNNAKLYGYNDV